jgi:hypothetical protein
MVFSHGVDGIARCTAAFPRDEQYQRIAHLRFLAALAAAGNGNALFFADDSGQRISQTAFSWKALDVDIRRRSRNLCINYRTLHQIRQ